MRVQPRKDKKGLTYFSFIFTHPTTNKVTRINKPDAPIFRDRPSAEAWARTQDANHAALKDAAQQRLEWQTKYHDFSEYAEDFTRWKKEKAPRAWARSVSALRQYVLHYFLNIRECNNANLWPNFYQPFIDWLGTDARKIKADELLSISSQNHIINALNGFIEYLATYRLIAPEIAKVKCPLHAGHKLGSRTFEDVYSDEEFADVEVRMRKKDEDAADFFYLLRHVGMRFNELHSLPMSTIYKGLMEGALHDELKEKRIDYFGYILLESQIIKDNKTDAKTRERKEDFSHDRGPLKGRKTISLENSKFIPVSDKKAWNILVKLHKLQQEKLQKQEFGINKVNYLLFDDIDPNRIRRCINSVYDEIGGYRKDFHCLRHTYSTDLVGRTRSFFLAKAILGHRTEKEFNKYCHIFAQLQLAAKQNSQTLDFV